MRTFLERRFLNFAFILEKINGLLTLSNLNVFDVRILHVGVPHHIRSCIAQNCDFKE